MKKHEIVLQEWSYECGDRCCSDYGWYLFINGVEIDRYFPYDEEYIVAMLKALGITEYEIDVIRDPKDYYDKDYFWDGSDDFYEDEEDAE